MGNLADAGFLKDFGVGKEWKFVKMEENQMQTIVRVLD